ncbi:hypothetical protein ACLMLE_27780, partial [Lysobacter capsici]
IGRTVPPAGPIAPPPPANRSPQMSQTPPPPSQPSPSPSAAPTDSNTSAPLTEQAQMEAIRKRIEARRAQLRQQQAAQPPANTP